MRNFQRPLFTPDTEWVMPDELRDLRGHKEIAPSINFKYTCLKMN